MRTLTSPAIGSAGPRIWIGHWLMVVAVLHTLFALVVLYAPLLAIAQDGLFNTVGQDPMRAATVWFTLFGAPLTLLAMAITPLERSGQTVVLRRLGWGLLMLTLIGVSLMPASGFWLAIPAGIALVRRTPLGTKAAPC